MIERFRVREVIAVGGAGGLARREHQQQAAVVVVRREDVRLRRLGPVSFGVHGNRLVQHPNAPLERGGDVVVAALELEAQHLVHRPADHVEVPQPRELSRPAPSADQPRLLVAEEERGVGGRVVVVEQLEEEAEPAFAAAARAALEAGRALGRRRSGRRSSGR